MLKSVVTDKDCSKEKESMQHLLEPVTNKVPLEAIYTCACTHG